jgi:hypothetical protein
VNVYWSNTGQLTPAGLANANTGSVVQVPIAAGAPVTLASSQNIPLGITVSGGKVYWAEFGFSTPGTLKSAPVGGGTVSTLVANVKDPFGIAISSGVVYWSQNVPSGIGNGKVFSFAP